MALKSIIWDVGGVLVRTLDYTPRTQLAEQYGMSCQDLELLVFGPTQDSPVQMGQITYQQHWATIGSRLHLNDEQIDTFRRAFFAGDQINAELVTYIRQLKTKYQTSVLSNALPNMRHLLEETWKIADAFHYLVISAEVGLMKPDPAIYHLAAEKTVANPQEIVFIDDSPVNIRGAQDSGLQAIHFLSNHQVKKELAVLLND